MDSRTVEVKISRDWRLVIRRVLLGGVGCERGGRSERSRDMFGEWRLEGEAVGGVEMSMAMVGDGVECAGVDGMRGVRLCLVRGLLSAVQRIIHVSRVVASRTKHNAGAVLLRPLSKPR